jgi:hypothetical protein
MASDANFYYNPTQTAIAIGYQNEEFIADEVLPRVSTGEVAKYTWRKYRLGESLTIPDTQIGRTSKANEVEYGYDEIEDKTEDYALKTPVPQSDVRNARGSGAPDPLGMATTMNMELIRLDREKRVADLVFNPTIYVAGQKVTLSGTDQWSHADSDPIDAILSALDVPFRRPNTMVIGRQGFTALRTHPKIVSAIQANSGQSGIVTAQAIASLFELKKVVVGSSWYNSSGNRASVSATRLWGKHCALIRQESVSLPYTMTFGITAQTGTPVGMTFDDPDMGLYGGTWTKAGESVKENICAPEYGYFFENIAA